MGRGRILFIFTILLIGSCLPGQPGVPDFPAADPVYPAGSDVPWPEWIFEHWVWEDESTQQSAIDHVEGYLGNDIPVGAVIIDSPWETAYNNCEFDTGRFPDAQAMIDHFHSLDVKVLMWITGVINIDEGELYQYAAERNFFMQTNQGSGPAVISWWKGEGSLIDFWNPEAVDWWKGLLDNVLDMGIDGWKCDGTDYYSLLTPWSPGAGSFVPRLQYSHAYYRVMHDYSRERLGPGIVNLVRPIDNYGVLDVGGDLVAFAPVDITWAGWVGDQDATFNGLNKALNNMYHSSKYGYLSFGSDIGGYRDNDAYANGRSKELFIRWAQLGALCPIMENGGGGEHRPWLFDEQTADIYREFTSIHYDLIPYIAASTETAWLEGRSVMQFFNKWNYSYLLGPDLFVAPVLNENHDVTIRFPEDGQWVYLFDRAQVFEPGTSITMTFSLDKYPVFLRKGSGLERILSQGL